MLPAHDPRTAVEWDAWLDARGVTRTDCIALPLTGDAASAAALLALLERRQSLLLWRQALDAGSLSTLPPWCSHALCAGTDGFTLLRCAAQGTGTSGSTGSPKFAAFTHEALLGNARNCIGRLQLTADDRVLIPVPVAHMYGLGAAFLPATLAGAQVRQVPGANLVRYLEAEAEFEPTVAFLTPSLAHLLVKGRKRARPYRLTVLAGDRAGESLFHDYERRHGCTVNLYGSTELGAIAAGSPQDDFAARSSGAGLPLPGVRLVSPGAAGEAFPLRIEHPFGFAGYAAEDGRPLQPPMSSDDVGWPTQDLGRLDAGGRLQLLGRVDHSAKRDGLLVAFGDIERALVRVRGIDNAVVVPGGATRRGIELVAICTSTARPAPTAVEIARALRATLPAHATPDRFVFVDALPLTATAKPDRVALGALVAVPLEERADAAPR